MVGYVVEAKQHPNADRLRVCTVDTGAGVVQVVCGAPHARTGMKGVFAPTGSYKHCRNAYGVYDMVGNLHEWTADVHDGTRGTFRGGYYQDTHLNGDGCSYRTVAHDVSYHDYSTGFRCCADPR